MRMDQRQKMTARDIVNDYSESELYRVIRDYGEVNEIISHAIPMKIQKTSGHPSKAYISGSSN